MKQCLSCGKDIADAEWQCSACGWKPARVDGFLSFAPELAIEGDDFPADAHEVLDVVQARSFWFRGRNRLITGIVSRYFADARRVLEIGCGTGFVLDGIGNVLPAAELVGSEVYTSGLRGAARRLNGRAELLQMDARHIPFRDCFDLVCAFDVIEHIDDDVAVIEQMIRAAKPGGGVFITVPQHPFLWSRTDELSGHKRRYRRNELVEKCRASGLDIILNTSFVSTLLPVMMAARLLQGRATARESANDLVPPKFFNGVFERILNMEGSLIANGVKLPFGGSRIVVARKKTFTD